MDFLKNKAVNLIKKTESIKTPLLFWAAYLYAVFVIRELAEFFFGFTLRVPKPEYLFIFWPLWYFALLLAIAIICFYFTKEKIGKVTKTIFLFAFVYLVLPPIDFIASGSDVSLRYPMSYTEVSGVLFSFGGVFGESILTIGQTVTIFLAAFLIFAYVFLKSKSFLKAGSAVALCYLAGTFYAALPFFLAELFGFARHLSEVAMISSLALLLIIALKLIAWLYLFNKNTLKILTKNIRMDRAMHYTGLVFIGGIFALFAQQIELNSVNLIALMFSAFFGFEAGLVYNNVYDKEIPGKIQKRQYLSIGNAMIVFSLLFAGIAGWPTALIAFASIIIGVAYSVPPTRLKKMGFLNNVVIGIISMLAFTAGIASQCNEFTQMHLTAMLAVAITFSLAGNLKDLKDFEKDKKMKIKTLPVLLGFEKSVKVIALLSSTAFLIPVLMLGFYFIIPIAVFFVIANYFVLNQTKNEKHTFFLYYLFLGILAIAMYLGIV